MEAEWHNAPEFAEVAEALGVNTVDVMALLPDRVVLYTPDPEDPDPMIWAAHLGRDADGILIAARRRELKPTSQFHAAMEELMRRAGE